MNNKKRFDKKAWLKIVEAFIAILIVLGTVLVILSGNDLKPDISKTVYEKQKSILDVISNDDILRGKIVNEAIVPGGVSNADVDAKISGMIPGNWEFETKICGLDVICEGSIRPLDRDVYVSERVISSTLDKYEPKKLRFFVWMK